MVVVVVRDKILNGIIGEKFLELTIKLSGKRFVRRHDQRGPLNALDNIGDGVGFSGASHP